MTTPADGSRTALPRGLMLLLGVAAAMVAVAGLRSFSDIAAPVFLALVLTIAVHPVRTFVRGRGWPEWLGTVTAMVVVYAILLALTLSMVVAGARLVDLLPTYQQDVADLATDAENALSRLGVGKGTASDALSGLDLSRLTDLVSSLVGGLVDATSSLVLIVSVLFFMALDGRWFPERLEQAGATRPSVATAFTSFAGGTRTWLVVSTVFGLIVASLDVAFLWLVGIPLPLLWGLLSFITNFIPNIGFVIGLVPPAMLGLLEGGPGLMLGVIAFYCVANFVIQSLIQPAIMGDAVGLSTTLSFLSVVFWTWVLGPLGALLAIPLTLLVKAVLVDADPATGWLRLLITGPDPKVRRGTRSDAPEPTSQSGLGSQPGDPPSDAAERRTQVSGET